MNVPYWDSIVQPCTEHRLLQLFIAFSGAAFVLIGSIPLPPSPYTWTAPYILTIGILLEVFLTYVFATAATREREAIEAQKQEIGDNIETLQSHQEKIEAASEDLFGLQREIDTARGELSDLKNAAEDAEKGAEQALRDVKNLKRNISNSLDRDY